MKLLELSTHDVARSAPQLAFWPVGTIEAHDLGPLGTDVLAPEKLASDLAPALGALLLPTLPFGLVASLAGYPGGMWMSEETYRRLVFELLSSLTRSSIRAVVVFNGHGGNTRVLGEVLADVWRERAIKTALVDWWTVGLDISERLFGRAGGHGGADELALVHAADPRLALPGWDGSRAFLHRAGVKTYPAPRSAIRYSDETPARPLDADSAAAYYAELKERVASVVREILTGWESSERG